MPDWDLRNHFEALVPRIYELGGERETSGTSFSMAACPDAYLPDQGRGCASAAGWFYQWRELRRKRKRRM